MSYEGTPYAVNIIPIRTGVFIHSSSILVRKKDLIAKLWWDRYTFKSFRVEKGSLCLQVNSSWARIIIPSSQFELGGDHYTFKSIRVGQGSLYSQGQFELGGVTYALTVNASCAGILIMSRSIRGRRGSFAFKMNLNYERIDFYIF